MFAVELSSVKLEAVAVIKNNCPLKMLSGLISKI